jgi:hypothetical protein
VISGKILQDVIIAVVPLIRFVNINQNDEVIFHVELVE